MPRSLYAWYSLNELEALGQREAQLSGEIDLKRLTRLRELLHSDDGSVRADFIFGQHRAGYLTVRLNYEVSLELVCQRCLEQMKEKACRDVSYVIVEAGASETGVPVGYEPITLSGERLQPAELIEDELIVSMPLIPRHARIEQCGALVRDSNLSIDDNESRPTDSPHREH